MSTSRRYHANSLELAQSDRDTLLALQAVIARSLKIISTQMSPADTSIYTGTSGIALMYLRLHIQAPALSPSPPVPPAIQFGNSLPKPPELGRVSPLDAQHGSYMVSLLQHLVTAQVPPDDLFVPIQDALSVAICPGAAQEVLYGTAGLLAGLISLRRIGTSHTIASSANILTLAKRLIEEGRAGAADYAAKYGAGLPLMWSWHGKYYLGAIHGIAGILTVLLQLPPEIRDPMMVTLLSAAYALLNHVDANGHLPSSLPRHHRSSGELVQLCHGAPGALLLIVALRSACAGQALPPQIDSIETRLSDRIWEEGLLRKGIPLCHGLSGNAWPWLLLAQLSPEEKKRELYLVRALTFLLHTAIVAPVGNADGYVMPENPYSLFEGLAGAVCAWSEACAILSNRLHPGEKTSTPIQVLGMPWLGGLGICGI